VRDGVGLLEVVGYLLLLLLPVLSFEGEPQGLDILLQELVVFKRDVPDDVEVNVNGIEGLLFSAEKP
jgi:hypothetical protein